MRTLLRKPPVAHIPALPAARREINAGGVKAMTQEEPAAASSIIGSVILTIVARQMSVLCVFNDDVTQSKPRILVNTKLSSLEPPAPQAARGRKQEHGGVPRRHLRQG